MGTPMARNIKRVGHDLVVYNRTRAKAEAFVAAGGSVAASPQEAAAGADVVCVCVSTPADVRAVVLGDSGVREGTHAGAVILDFSSIDPETSRDVAAACAERGVPYLDAPVSGGTAGARDGTLTVIVGGDHDAFVRAQPVLEAVGQTVRHVGDSGTGSTIKLINQMLVATNLAAVLEAFVIGEKAGITSTLLYEVLSTSSGRSQMLEHAVPGHLLAGDFTPGFATRLLYKDLTLALAMCRGLGVAATVPEATASLYQQAIATGQGDQDMSASVVPLAARAGVSFMEKVQ